MGLESLLARLEAEVREREAAIEAEANRQAAEILAEAERAVRDERATFHRARERELQRELDAAVAEARHAANAATLTARERLLGRVFAESLRGIPALTEDPRLLDTLAGRFADAREYVGDAEIAVRCSPALVAALKRIADRTARGVTVEVSADVGTGFVLETADGSLTVDATLERALERHRREIAARLLTRLEELEPCPSTSAT